MTEVPISLGRGLQTGILRLMQRAFLKAHWSNVAIISYPVPADLLTPHVPRGCELDTLHGTPFISLVAFDFDDVAVKGWAIPGYRAFPEVNLRFYVKRGEQRGVCFIREFVPKRVVAWVARFIYNEPYQRVPMASDVHRLADGTRIEHTFRVGGRTQRITLATTKDPPLLPSQESDETWFKEHEWGFGRDRAGFTLMYRVAHPQWLTYRLAWHEIKVDWAQAYGSEWKILRGCKPASIILAEGSPVTVFQSAKVA